MDENCWKVYNILKEWTPVSIALCLVTKIYIDLETVSCSIPNIVRTYIGDMVGYHVETVGFIFVQCHH